MDEDPSFTSPVSLKIICFTFVFIILYTFFAFNSLGGENALPQTEDDHAEELPISVINKCKPVPAAGAIFELKTPQVEDASPPTSPDSGGDTKILSSLREKSRLFHPIILKAANRHEIDPALVKAIIMAESGYDPQAVSSQGATGLMQLMPKTAEALGVEDAFNPEHNVNAGVKYLKQLLEEFDADIKLALAAYNAGSSTVKRYRGIPPIKATQYYVEKVFAYYQYYKNEATDETDSA